MKTSTSANPGAATDRRAGRPTKTARGASLYELVGGHEALAAAVTVFYQRVLADPELRPWFDGVDMARLRSHQRAFLAAALGGPDLFAGRDLTTVHRGLKVTSRAFDAVVDHLACALRDLGVGTAVVARVGEHVDALRPQIVDSDTDGPAAPRRGSDTREGTRDHASPASAVSTVSTVSIVSTVKTAGGDATRR